MELRYLKLLGICEFVEGTFYSRNMTKGEAVLKAGQVVLVGSTTKTGEVSARVIYFPHLHRSTDLYKKVGVALKPCTPVDVVVHYIDQADMILVMTVEPGFGGQKFMEPMMEKVAWLRKNYPTLDIAVDGGVGLNTIQFCAEAGANMIVTGTAVTGSSDPGGVIRTLKDTVNNALSNN